MSRVCGIGTYRLAERPKGRTQLGGRGMIGCTTLNPGASMPDASTLTLFDEQEIRAAERVLEAALAADDPTAWVNEYTDDAIFDGGGDHVVQGREALLGMARSMRPLSSVSIRPRHTEGCGHLATVWYEASWVSGSEGGSPVEVRGMILWRKEADGHWRVALEHLG
jgi:ketosteroid isomerase-like protein